MRCSAHVKIVSSERFIFPRGYEPVSAIYEVSFSETLLNPVVVKMQHCVCINDNNMAQNLTFAIASASYQFKPIIGGSFPVNERYGQISRSSFSLFTILKQKLTNCK